MDCESLIMQALFIGILLTAVNVYPFIINGRLRAKIKNLEAYIEKHEKKGWK